MSSNTTAAAGVSSASALVSTLIPSLAIAVIAFSAFLYFRHRQQRVYEPRAHVGFLHPNQKPAAPAPGFKGFIQALRTTPDVDVLKHQSLDAYLFVRYLKICTVICFVGCCITWPILFPVNATGRAPNVVQLDELSMAKISNKDRYYAHALVAWVFFGFVLFMITRESIYFINLRTAYLLSQGHEQRISSRTVLFTFIPKAMQNKESLLAFFGGEAKNIWIGSDCEKLAELVEERDTSAMKLENAEIKLCRTGHGKYLEAEKKKAKLAKKGGKQTPPSEDAVNVGKGKASTPNDVESAAPASSAYAQWIDPKKDRPTHKLKFLIGKKVDTIEWCQKDLVEKIPQVAKLQEEHRLEKADFTSSAFVEFVSQEAAQAALQSSYRKTELKGVAPYIGIQPFEVIWKNVALSSTSRRLRSIAATTFVILLIIFWAIPVAIVGAISNINFLTDKVHFLRFINDIPSVILGVVTGLLPVVALSILMSLVPVFCRMLAKAGGAVSTSHVELWCQQWYFTFNIIQVFLVVTIASAATAVVTKIIKEPSSATSLLANNLPGASNFYISYFILQGLSIASMGLLQIGGLAGFTLLSRFLDGTPRKLFNRWNTLASVGWGSLYPQFSMMCAIAIVYSCIAPLVLGFATVGIFLMYLGFKYNFLFVFTTVVNTNGAAYPRALQHLMVGVYIGEICLLGLFGIKVATGPLVLLGILTIATIIYHIILNRTIDPLLKYLPLTHFGDENPRFNHRPTTQDTSEAEKTKLASPTTTNSPLPPKSIKFLMKLFHIDPTTTKPTPTSPGNKFSRFIHVNTYSSPSQLSQFLATQRFGDEYDENIIQDAYYNPAITSQVPVIWIARDELGISREEISKTDDVILISDEGAYINGKNKVVWDRENFPDPVVRKKDVVY